MAADFEDVAIVAILVGGFMLYKVGSTVSSAVSSANTTANNALNTANNISNNISKGVQSLANAPTQFFTTFWNSITSTASSYLTPSPPVDTTVTPLPTPTSSQINSIDTNSWTPYPDANISTGYDFSGGGD